MKNDFINTIVETVEQGFPLSSMEAEALLTDRSLEIPDIIGAAWHFRRQYFGREVMVQVLNNAQNGMCPEDCRYCAQSASSSAPIETYAMKTEEEIIQEADMAHRNGAGRYCMVFSGTGPTEERIRSLAALVRNIKARYPLEVCVSAGVLDEAQARVLKEAGLDRLNHNINTSETHYRHICSSHSYTDRLRTIQAAHRAGLQVCSGVIIGMGETPGDIYAMTQALRAAMVASIPVNFLIPIPGIAIKEAKGLSPDYCLRVLALFRLMNPKAEIRMAAGREMHLRSLEPLGLYIANSLFLQGYLNARGASDTRTLRMIQDAGFTIRSEVPLETLLKESSVEKTAACELKTKMELRPFDL